MYLKFRKDIHFHNFYENICLECRSGEEGVGVPISTELSVDAEHFYPILELDRGSFSLEVTVFNV